MPEILKKGNGEIDWSKVFMGFAVAVVFIMQQWHSMQMADIKTDLVPRPEYTEHRRATADKDTMREMFKALNERFDTIETAFMKEGKSNEPE